MIHHETHPHTHPRECEPTGRVERDAQRQYVVIGTLAPIIVEFMCSFVVIGAAAPKGAMSC